jgi:ATP-dependent Lon protease
MEIINRYTKEAGVRDLQRNLSTIVRKIVTKSVRESNSDIKVTVKKNDLKKYLGEYKYDIKNEAVTSHLGIVNGLAYTPMGGLVMPVETALYNGKGEIIITGMVGQSMEESIEVAISYLKSNKDLFGIDPKIFKDKDLHVHFLDGAQKKDGPSAGVAIVTSLISLLTGKEVPKNIGMTGEVSLNGDVLKVGGIREKVIGAYNDGVNKIFMPYTNSCDLEELPKVIKDEIDFVLVKNYEEIFNEIFK